MPLGCTFSRKIFAYVAAFVVVVVAVAVTVVFVWLVVWLVGLVWFGLGFFFFCATIAVVKLRLCGRCAPGVFLSQTFTRLG